MSTFAVRADTPLSLQITNLLKELHVIEHPTLGSPGPEPLVRDQRRQEIRRELVRIVSLLGWRNSYPLRLWMYGRQNKWIQ